MILGVSSYSFQQAISNGKITQKDAIDEAYKLGFSAIEFTTLEPCESPTFEQMIEYAKEIKSRADELGMTICNYAIGANLYNDDKDELAKTLKTVKEQVLVAKELGVPVMRHDICYTVSPVKRSFDLMLPQIVENVREITQFAMEHGIKTCSENHGYVAQDSDRMERLFNAVNHSNYGLLVDIGNFMCADENPLLAVSRVAPYAIHVHAKDFHLYEGDCEKMEGTFSTRGGNFLKGAVVGEGDVPVIQCLRSLKRTGYDGFLSIEYEGAEDCFEGIRRGKENLEKFLEIL
ncbi:MAG: sugar phosphate isomerase/epimerase [Clostridia bacterium]|nr:sugar phosphate isomerase/epimerase [Clostridia bacterium]